MAENFPHPIPNGWFALMADDELEVGQVARVEALGREFVVYRTASGDASIVAAFCPHLGAHLGFGGRVEGEAIVCPFHGWRFGRDGACVEIPYARKVPPKARLKRFESVSVNGWIFVWHHAEGAPPSYRIPVVPGLDDPGWAPPVRFEWTIGAQFQELFENVCDPAHFRFVHGTETIPESEVRFEGAAVHSLDPARMTTSKGAVQGMIDAHTIGPGFGYVRYDIVTDMLQITSSLPLDEKRTIVRHEYHVRDGDRVGPALIREIRSQMDQDIPIWNHKTYHAQPILCDGDGPIAQGRKWMRQFYCGG